MLIAKGKVPFSLLFANFKLAKADSFPIDEGIVPTKPKRLKSIVVRVVIEPILLGILPARGLAAGCGIVILTTLSL